jgi:hypothetical protein
MALTPLDEPIEIRQDTILTLEEYMGKLPHRRTWQGAWFTEVTKYTTGNSHQNCLGEV